MRDFMSHHIYKFKKVCPLLVVSLVILWPATVMASQANQAAVMMLTDLGLGAPFMISWTTIWFFAISGGLMANFLKLDIDQNFHFVYIAKPFIGTILAMAVVMYLNENVNPPDPAYAITALGTAIVGAPLTQGVLVYLTKTNIIEKVLNFFVGKYLGGNK